MKSTNPANTIAQRFDRAAGSYDESASVQAQIARHLVERAVQSMPHVPASILDIGCGTGFAAACAARHWPEALITAIDNASGMLEQARRKVPELHIVKTDIAGLELNPTFDLILSSMALHWLPDPRAALLRWQKGLTPQGRMFVALLVEGSFAAWLDLCAAHKVPDGLWPLPRADFAETLAAKTELQVISVNYPSAQDFLRRVKAIGAATPRLGHKPSGISSMRRLLAAAPKPFAVTYRVLYVELPASPSI